MTEYVLQPRNLDNQDWAAILFVITLILIAVTRSVFENRFSDFIKLAVSNKYIKIYRDSSHLMSWFNVALFIVNLVSFAFFIQLTLSYFGYAQKTDWILFIRIITLLGVFIVSKYLIEKIIAVCFNIEEFTEQFNLQKVSYRTYIGLLILPVDFILFYNDNAPVAVIFMIIAAVLIMNILIYLISLKNYQNFIFGKMFYFILYLCALEIAPYYFMYYWFAKS